jgi:multiple sugar transport system substrate-binding protein
MIQMAERMQEAGRIEIQGAAYEGYTVWFNSLIQSAGGSILNGTDRVGLPTEPTRKALDVIGKLARSKAADPSLPTQREDQNRLAFEEGQAAFQINYPFIYSSARDNKAEIFRDIGWTTYPRVDADKPAKAPIGGFNWGVGGNTKNPDQAFQAAVCLRNEENQRAYALKGGLPPTLSRLYEDPAFQKEYPFWREIRDSLAGAGVRPVSPVYADVSLAVYTILSPPKSVTPQKLDPLRSAISDALQSKGLL